MVTSCAQRNLPNAMCRCRQFRIGGNAQDRRGRKRRAEHPPPHLLRRLCEHLLARNSESISLNGPVRCLACVAEARRSSRPNHFVYLPRPMLASLGTTVANGGVPPEFVRRVGPRGAHPYHLDRRRSERGAGRMAVAQAHQRIRLSAQALQALQYPPVVDASLRLRSW
jgi:hypothetical protein